MYTGRMKKYYAIQFSYNDPYPKTFMVRPQEGANIGRAIDKAYHAFKSSRPGKREPKNMTININILSG